MPRLALAGWLDAVVQRNLDLQAQAQTVAAARAGVSIAGVRPDPQFTGGMASKELYGPNRANAATAATAGLAFTLETGGKRDARLRAARSNVELALTNLAAFRRQLETDAAAAFVEACRAEATRVRKESSLVAMRDIVRANEVRFKAGDIGRLELVQSRVEAERFEADVVSARATAAGADFALSNFVDGGGAPAAAGRALDCDWGDAAVEGDIDALVARALEARDDIRQARATAENARDNVELARANRSVDPTLNVGLTNTPRIGPMFDAGGNLANTPAQRSLTLGVTLSVPIPLSRLQQGELVQAESALTQAQLQLRSATLKAETDMRVAYAQYRATAANAQAYADHVLADAQHVLDGMRTSYRRGASSLLELLNAQRSADEVWLASLQARADRANATVKLQQSLALHPAL